MKEPSYCGNIVVGVIHNSEWQWYVSEKEFWILDYEKQSGGTTSIEHLNWRFGIVIVSGEREQDILSNMSAYLVTTEQLQTFLLVRLAEVEGKEEQEEVCADFLPSLLVDFDSKSLDSMYTEITEFDRYVPNGWVGKYQEFWNKVPEANRFWIIDGVNKFTETFQ